MLVSSSTQKFNYFSVGYFAIIASGQVVFFPHSQPIFLVLVTMGIAFRLFTLKPYQKRIRFLALSLCAHHIAFSLLSLYQFYASATYRWETTLEYQLVYVPFMVGLSYVYFNVWRRRAYRA